MTPTCPVCKTTIDDPAELFLHEKAHAAPFGGQGLNQLPFILFPAVAQVMRDYANKPPIGGAAMCAMSDMPPGLAKGYILGVINERLGWHRDNLAGWREGTGYLCPTEPDLDERRRVRANLTVAVEVLEELKKALGLE